MSNAYDSLRQLGNNRPIIPAIGLGLVGISMRYGKAPSDEERFAVLDEALKLGATYWGSSK